MEYRFELPDLGEDAPDEAQVSFWYVQEGEDVKDGQDLVEMVTDKAAFTVPSPVRGLLRQILVQEGGTAKVGQALAVIETREET